MNVKRYRPLVVPFLIAAAVATAVGTVIQTQINLSAVQAMGGPVTPALRLQTTLQDLGGFTSAYAGIVIATLLCALPAAAWLGRRVAHPALRAALYGAAAAVGLAVAFQVADAFAPMPTLIAATRSALGTLWMMQSGLVGGLVFAVLRAGAERRSKQRAGGEA